MIDLLGAAALTLVSAQQDAAPAPVQPPAATAFLPELPMAEATAVRCSAAFGLAVKRQKQGDAAALQWPDLKDRGREFFLRSLQSIMIDHELSQGQVQALVMLDLGDLERPGRLGEVMPGCLLLLDASGL